MRIQRDLARWYPQITADIPARLRGHRYPGYGRGLNVYKTVGGTDGCCAPAPKLETLSACCGGGQSAHAAMKAGRDLHDSIADLFRGVDLNNYAASVKIFALKPR